MRRVARRDRLPTMTVDDDGIDGVRRTIDGAAEVAGSGDGKKGRRANVVGIHDARRRREPVGPEDTRIDKLPFKLLGNAGDQGHLLDSQGQLRAYLPREFGRQYALQISGRHNHKLPELFARVDKNGKPTGYIDLDGLQAAVFAAQGRMPIFDPAAVCGRGAHLGPEGELIFHCGDKVLIGRQTVEPGVHDGRIFPAGAQISDPCPAPVPAGDRGPGKRILDRMQAIKFRRDIDATLAAGWILAAAVGGAMAWRPTLYLMGGAGTGKSTTHKFIEGVYPGEFITSSDASPAGISQLLRYDTLPLGIDEFEAKLDNRKNDAKLDLVRGLSSGSVLLRGSADHSGHQAALRSCVMLSSVTPPPLSRADRSRMIMLELLPPTSRQAPDDGASKLNGLASLIKGRWRDVWARFTAETLPIYRAALMDVGHSARGADVYGPVLAAVDVFLHDAEPSHDHVAEIVEQLRPDAIADLADDMSDEERCLRHLLSSLIPPDGSSTKQTVGDIAALALGIAINDGFVGVSPDSMRLARDMLMTFGMRWTGDGERRSLAVANTHSSLARLFVGTPWASPAGSTAVFVQMLRRLPGASASADPVRFGSLKVRATLLPFDLVLPGRTLARGYAGPAELDDGRVD